MFRGKRCYDGGLTNFIPLPPTQHGVRVCCFPSKQISAVYDIGISPDNYEDWPHTLQEMLSWAFEPASDKLLLEFIGKPAKPHALCNVVHFHLSHCLCAVQGTAAALVQMACSAK